MKQTRTTSVVCAMNTIVSRQSRVTLQCQVCQADFWTHTFRANTAKYCSKACWSQRSTKKECPVCGGMFKFSAGTREKYCGMFCRKIGCRGPESPGWKGGATINNARGRASNNLHRWRTDVYQRDKYTCQRCKAKGVTLHAHHIRPFATHPGLRFDVQNGITLCVPCHGKEHARDFANIRQKRCPTCDVVTTGRGEDGLCRDCARKRRLALGWYIKNRAP